MPERRLHVVSSVVIACCTVAIVASGSEAWSFPECLRLAPRTEVARIRRKLHHGSSSRQGRVACSSWRPRCRAPLESTSTCSVSA
jgi:hypothetical protein